MEESLCWLWLAEQLYANQAAELMKKYGTARHAYEEIRKGNHIPCRSLKEDVYTRLSEHTLKEVERKREEYGKRGIGFVSAADPLFPDSLRQACPPVNWLYHIGTFPDKTSRKIAVVGARACSGHGAALTRKFAKELAAAGMDIISGMAAGIDGQAHEGALLAGGRTFAVLGCGVDICYPSVSRSLYERIPERGGILSEYRPGTRPLALHFPQRNRIISALSDGILVVEARRRSGSLITAEQGLEQGKNIYAVPGRPDDVLSEGCNYLIASGAKLTGTAADILEDYGLVPGGVSGNKETVSKILLETTEKIVYACLRCEPKHINQIQQESGLALPELLSSLLKLELMGYAGQASAGFYVLGDTSDR